MSTINKKPFIKLVLESMSAEEIAALSALIDGSGNQTALLRTMSNKPVGNRTNITSADKGVHLCNLESGYTLFQGYLIYTDVYCVLIHFTDAQVLGMFNIDLNNLTSYATVSEALSVLELRSEVYDIANSGGSGSSAVESIDYSNTLAPLQGVEINDIQYRMLPLPPSLGQQSVIIGTPKYYNVAYAVGISGETNNGNGLVGDYSVAIGYKANNIASMRSVTIGSESYCSMDGGAPYGDNVAIGVKSYVYSLNAVAIGYLASNHARKTVTFDSKESDGIQRTLHMYDPTKIFFRNKGSEFYSSLSSYTAGHYLSEYIQNNPMHCANTNGTTTFAAATADSVWYPEYTDTSNYKTFTKNVVSGVATAIDKKITGVHIVIELRSYSRNCVSLDLLPYDSTYGSCYSYGRIVIELNSGRDKLDTEIKAYIDSDGAVQIYCPNLDWVGDFYGTSPDMSVKYTIK